MEDDTTDVLELEMQIKSCQTKWPLRLSPSPVLSHMCILLRLAKVT